MKKFIGYDPLFGCINIKNKNVRGTVLVVSQVILSFISNSYLALYTHTLHKMETNFFSIAVNLLTDNYLAKHYGFVHIRFTQY
jgi:hypothetical protein